MATGRWQVAGKPTASRRQADRGAVRHRRARTAMASGVSARATPRMIPGASPAPNAGRRRAHDNHRRRSPSLSERADPHRSAAANRSNANALPPLVSPPGTRASRRLASRRGACFASARRKTPRERTTANRTSPRLRRASRRARSRLLASLRGVWIGSARRQTALPRGCAMHPGARGGRLRPPQRATRRARIAPVGIPSRRVVRERTTENWSG
jgi:hypothetical protein